MKVRKENWCGHIIRFIEINGEWLAILEDICDALELQFDEVEDWLDLEMVYRVRIPEERHAIPEIAIYEALFASDKIEARKFRRWTGSVMQKLRTRVGLEPYEVMRMTEPEIQDEIDHILDTLFWDEEQGRLMQSVTVQGGDVEQVPFE